jgi:hypothetical protein
MQTAAAEPRECITALSQAIPSLIRAELHSVLLWRRCPKESASTLWGANVGGIAADSVVMQDVDEHETSDDLRKLIQVKRPRTAPATSCATARGGSFSVGRSQSQWKWPPSSGAGRG